MGSAEEVLINLVGKDNLSSVINKSTTSFSNLKKEAGTAQSSVNRVGDSGASMDKLSNSTRNAAAKVQELGKSSSSVDKVGGSASTASTMVNKLGSSASGAQTEITKVGGASGAIDKVTGSASKASKGMDGVGAAGSKAGATAAGGMDKAASAAEGLSGMLSQLIAGFGLMQIASSAATGAMSKEMNQALLTRKYGAGTATQMTSSIQDIVANVPGDDTFMNTLLTQASYQGGVTNTGILSQLGSAAADYTRGGLLRGQRTWESEMELKDYILNGNTAMMQRDGILRKHLDKLEGIETVEGRIAALQEALNAEGLEGISQLDVTTNLWEEVKGKIQLALTELGSKFLPIAKGVLDVFLWLDDVTGGWSSSLLVIAGTFVAIAGTAGLITGPIRDGVQLFKDMHSGARIVLEKLGLIAKADCNKTCVTQQVSECSTVPTGKVGSSGKWYTKIPGYSTVAAGLAGAGQTGILGAGISMGTATGLGLLGGAVVGAIDSTVVRPIANYLSTDLKGLGGQAIGGIFRMPSRFFGGGSYDGPFGTGETAKGLEADLESGNYLGFLTKTGPLGAVRGTIEDIAGGVKSLGETLSLVDWGKLTSGLKPVTKGLSDMFNLGKFKFKLPSIAPVTNLFKRIPTMGRQELGKLPVLATSAFIQTVGNATSGARRVVSGVWGVIQQLPGIAYQEFMRIGQSILSAGGALYNYAYQAALNIVNGLKSALGIASPGIMYKMVKGELGNIYDVMGEYQTTLGLGSTSLGRAVLRNFNMIENTPTRLAAQTRPGTMGENHIHQHHEQITIDASHMSADELKSLLLNVLSGMNKTTVPNVKFS